MSRFLIATMPVPGHVAPITPVARTLVERGHDIAWYGSKYHADSIVRSGASFRPIRSTVDYGDGRYPKRRRVRPRACAAELLPRDAILTILGEPGFRTRAAVIQTDFARHDAAAEAADLLERLADTQQPVLRA
jgi:UDP:flavonoid glycosyltransferase YjiC (YdhE family)